MKTSLIIALISISLLLPNSIFANSTIPNYLPCSYKYLQNTNNTFQDYESHEYINGLLRIHFKLTDNTHDLVLNAGVIITPDVSEGCYVYYPWYGTITGLTIPAHTINVSLRFLSPTHFSIWNDDLNQEIKCGNCDIDFSNSPHPSNLKQAYFSLSTPNMGSDVIISTSFLITNGATSKIPIVIVPGVLGTDIFKGNDLLWANVKMSRGLDGFMDPLAFDSTLLPGDNSLTIGPVIRDKSFTFVHLDYTQGLINELTNQGYTEGKDLFTFPYDWRFGVNTKDKSGQTNVDHLKGQIDYILNQTDAGKSAGMVNIIAHSTGGLLVKQYVIDHPTDHHINKAIFVGVPNLGSPLAFKALLVGDDFGVFNLDPAVMKKIGQNMPVVYDLAPTQQYYDQIGSFFHVHNPLFLTGNQDSDLNFTDTIANFENQKLINTQAIANSQALHTAAFDNFDLRTAGVDLYAIYGCKTATFGKFTETFLKDSAPVFDFPKVTSGDGTVPFMSANSLPVEGAKTYFATNIQHSSLLSADGSRQQIVNLLTGSSLDTKGKILIHQDVLDKPSLCQIKGENLKIKSPILVDIIDAAGNHSGPLPDGSIENSIPGADYEEWGDHKYVFLPTDAEQKYNIKLKGVGNGTFTLEDESINGDMTLKTQIFNNLPVTLALAGQVSLGTTTLLSLDNNGDGKTDQIVQPNFVLDPNQSQDTLAPISTSTISGTMGQPGFYRSNVNITLNAQDPVVPGHESETSGVYKTFYRLDSDGSYLEYTRPIKDGWEGQHYIKFYSIDKAGNSEPEQTVYFTIDRTPPEITMQFNPPIKDLQFTAADNFTTTTQILIVGQDNQVTATDQAGNTTQLQFSQKDRKQAAAADLQAISYNGYVSTVPTSLHFDWQYFTGTGALKSLNQQIRSQNTSISAVFNINVTAITGAFNLPVNGAAALKIYTNKGDLGWTDPYMQLMYTVLR